MKTFQRVLFWLSLLIAVFGIALGVTATTPAMGAGAVAISVGSITLMLASRADY